MAVYLIRAGECGPVKIGYAEDVQSRLNNMQTGNHETLTVLRIFEGGQEEESRLHARFIDLRIRGEWFSFSRVMMGDLGLTEIVQKAPEPRPVLTVDSPDPILFDIEQFLRARDMTATAFGYKALGDPTLVHELRKGRECKRTTRARIIDFMEAERRAA